MRIIVSNNIRIIDPDDNVKNWSEKNLVIKNPDFKRNIRLGYSNYKTPRNLVFYKIDGNDLILPFGSLSELFKMYSKDMFSNHIVLGNKLEYDSEIKLYDYQERACKYALSAKNGIIVMGAGSGKTQTALELIARLGLKTLWITHTLDLVNQSYDRAKDNFRNIGLGKIASGKVEIGTHVTFATVQTLSKLDLKEYADTWDCIIVDECHRVCGTPASAGMFYKVIDKLIARYKYGLTATPYRNAKGTEKAMFGLLGNTIIEIGKDEVKDKIIPATIQKIETNFNEVPEDCFDTDGTIKYSLLTSALSENAERNNQISELLQKNNKKHVLVLGDRVNQLKELSETVKYSAVIDGTMTSKKNKQLREEQLERMRQGKINILFATYGLAKEGLDIPILDRLFLISPHRDKATVIQSVGRIERKFEGKENPIVYDFVDGLQYYDNMWKTRKRYYKQNGNVVKEYGI